MTTLDIQRRATTAPPWARPAWRVAVPLTAAAAGIVAAYAMRWQTGLWLLSVYGLLAAGRVVVQTVMAARARAQARTHRIHGTPMVSIVVAVYNEPADVLDRALRSLATQDWPRFEVIVVDDGSTDPAPCRDLCERYGFVHAYQPNAGKRHAMYRAFGMLHPDSRYVLAGDSDTQWHPDATTHLVAALQANPRAGAAAGYIAANNAGTNLLTRVTALRYWQASQIERAAQGHAGVVTCVSGAIGIYRRHLIDQVKDQFISQRFMGRECTFGDDRHLTNLVLLAGHRVVYSRAQAWTEVPDRLGKFLRQQVRWGKSHWREMLWTAKALPRQPWFLAYEWLMALLMPFLLVASVGWSLAHLAAGEPTYLWHLAAAVVVMALVRVAPAIATTRDPAFLLLVPYALLHLAVLVPLKFWSLATVAKGHWGTRPANIQPQEQAVTR